MNKPIKPSDIAQAKSKYFPEIVFETFNQMIAEKYTNGSATLKQDSIIQRLEEAGLDRKEIYANGWLNVEEAYRAEGWKVSYDKPAYYETYDAYFTFEG